MTMTTCVSALLLSVAVVGYARFLYRCYRAERREADRILRAYTDMKDHLDVLLYQSALEDDAKNRTAERLGVDKRWYHEAWPLAQVTLVLSTPPGGLKSIVPDMLRKMSLRYENPEIQGMLDISAVKGVREYHRFRVVRQEPSFFVGGCGSGVSPLAWESVIFDPEAEPERDHLLVLAQRNRREGASFFCFCFEQITDALEKGLPAEADHDDDCGWAYRAYPASVTPADSIQ
ncbi:hypothetical protein [Pantoea stewartii]|uniref:hypothetical protein n=1 Tax=Pantoea stewartii TaxID=66269 RepID=UPI00345BF78E